MIDERFALAEFEKNRGDKVALRALSDLLADEIYKELHPLIATAMKMIVDRLNSLGHNLRPYGADEEGHIAVRDDEEDASGYDCKLRVASDFTISTGYRDVCYSKSNPEGLYPEEVRERPE